MMRAPILPTDPRHAVRGRYPAPLWDAGALGLVLVSRPALGWVGESMDQLARAIGAAIHEER